MSNKQYELNEADAEVIVALADCGMNRSEAARRINRHRNYVEYHIIRITLATGKDALNFYDLAELLPLAKALLEE